MSGPIKLQACSVRLQRINDGIFTGRDVSVDKNQNVIKSKKTLASQNISRSVRFAVSDPPQTNLDSINLSPILSQKNNRISSVSTPKYTPRSTKESPIDEDLFQILKNDSIEYFEKQLNTVKTEKKKRVAGKKTAKKSTRKFLPKSEIVFQFQRFLEFPVDKEVIPELMETCEKFNDLSLRRLKTMLTERKCTTPTLAHVKELMIETNLISDMGKLTNWSLYKNIVQVADFEVQNLLIPESGYSDLPKNLWDFEDQQ